MKSSPKPPESVETAPNGQAHQGSPVGPNPPENFPASPEAQGPVGPEPAPDYVPPKDGYVLVLGPGLARGMAYLGVLRELEEKQKPISAIVGVEMGALIGTIWASSSLNGLEWEMHKFKKETLLDYPLNIPLIGRKVARGKKLHQFLKQAVKVEQLRKMKVPTWVASLSWGNKSNQLLIENSGNAADIVRGAMAIPGILKPFAVENTQRISAASDTPFPVEQAKQLGLGDVVCVDVIGRGDNFEPADDIEEQIAVLMHSVGTIARQQLKECDEVITVSTDGVGYLDFDAKADLIFQGREAVKKWLD
ncbi:MAG: patatin-like phospholipase family protein [Bdellovibrionota bacterium]